MLFTSYGFILFIAVVFTAYYLIPKRHQWKLLLASSLFFYGCADIRYLLYLSATIVTTYAAARRIGGLYQAQDAYLKDAAHTKDERKAYKAANKARRWRWLLLCLFANFGILSVVKYTDFAIANINSLLRLTGWGAPMGFMRFVLPLGISFYTFQTMGYIIDVYRGKYPPEPNLGKLALFASFFPQMIQGPISRFDELAVSLFQPHRFVWEDVYTGFRRVLLGFFKKLVIADRLMVAVKTVVGDPEVYQGAYVLIGIFFYAITLYMDFTGGIDITIGVAKMLGIKLAENFDRPFLSRSITEYWRRWHITMGTWFRDYLFYPLSVCKPMLKFSKWARKKLGDKLGRKLPVFLSTMLVWFATGIWHGASWNFIVWGLTNGVVILISGECAPLYAKFHSRFKWGQSPAYHAFQVFRTFWLMSFIRTFDCYRDVGTTLKMFGTIVTRFNLRALWQNGLLDLGLQTADYLVAGVAVLALVVAGSRSWSRRGPLLRYAVCLTLFVAVLVFGAYGVGYDASQFIYNQF